jgi:hypothetical protein
MKLLAAGEGIFAKKAGFVFFKIKSSPEGTCKGTPLGVNQRFL